MRPFSINIRSRVKNFNLPKNQPLVPLFEARQTWFYGEEHMAELQLQMHHRLTI